MVPPERFDHFPPKGNVWSQAAQTATFFAITVIPWLIKPIYGLISDFVLLFGQRRKSYFVLTSGIATAMGIVLSTMASYSYWGVQITGGWLYDQLGFTRLIFISAAFTALCWLLVPLLKLEKLENGA